MAKLSHVWIPVSDIERSKAFYADKLGLTLVREQTVESVKVAYLKNEGNNVFILAEKPSLQSLGESYGSQIAVGWSVKNLEAVMINLEKRGVVFEGEMLEVPGFKMLHMKDPDGHLMQLTQTG